MSGRFRLRKISQKLHHNKPDEPFSIPGELGLKLGGEKLVEVPSRPGFVYVRLRNDQSEVVQAYNDRVSLIYGLPVTVVRDRIDKGRYYISGRDVGRYNNWGSSSYLPRHGAMHSFNPDAPGADPVWIWSRQFTPMLGVPSGSSAGMNVLVYPGTLYFDNRWIYAGYTGTPDLSAYKPTGANARMVLIYLNQSGNPILEPGSTFFDVSYTGTQQVYPYIPAMPTAGLVPIAGVRLLSGSSFVSWDNLYDLRQFLHWGVFTGTAGGGGGAGHTIQDDGTPLTARTYLNFVGPTFSVYDDPVNGATVVSGTVSAGGSGLGVLAREIAFGTSTNNSVTGTTYFKLRSAPGPRVNVMLNGVGDAMSYDTENSFNFIRQDKGQDHQIAIWNYISGTSISDEWSRPPRIRFYSAKNSEPNPSSIVSGSVLGQFDYMGYGTDDWYMGGMARVVAIQPGTFNNINAVMQFSAGNSGSLSFSQTYMNPGLEIYQDRVISYKPVAVSTGTNQGFYWGNIYTDGSWRSVVANERIEFQKLIGGVWVTWGYSASGTAAVSGYTTIQDDGADQTQRTKLNFVGSNFVVYDDGSVTVVSGTVTAGGSAHTIQNAGTPLTARANLNFLGGLVAYDDAGNNATIVSGTAGSGTDLTNAVILAPTSSTRNRIIPTGNYTTLSTRGYSGTSVNMVEFQNYSGSVKAGVDSLGRLFSYGPQARSENLFMGGAGNGTWNSGFDGYTLGIGLGALAGMTSANDNLAIGADALAGVTDQRNNTAVGIFSNNNNNGLENSTFGFWAGYAFVTGSSYNTVIGSTAAGNDSRGIVASYNVIIGRDAGYAFGGGTTNAQPGSLTYNVIIGNEAANNPRRVATSVVIGYNAMASAVSGSSCVYIGYGAGQNNTGDGNVFIGYNVGNALTATANTLLIENSNDTTNPLIKGDFSTGAVYINESANAKSTSGLTINQGANDDEIISLKSSDVAHGITDVTETDTFGRFTKYSATAGGVIFAGYSEDVVGQALVGVATNTDTNKSTSANGTFVLRGLLKNGTTFGNSISNQNIVAVQTFVSGSLRTISIIDAEGDLHLDATSNINAWDEYDDVALLNGVRAIALSPKEAMETRWSEWIEYARPILEKTGVITVNGDGHHFLSTKRLNMLQIDAIRQISEQMETLRERAERAEARLDRLLSHLERSGMLSDDLI